MERIDELILCRNTGDHTLECIGIVLGIQMFHCSEGQELYATRTEMWEGKRLDTFVPEVHMFPANSLRLRTYPQLCNVTTLTHCTV